MKHQILSAGSFCQVLEKCNFSASGVSGVLFYPILIQLLRFQYKKLRGNRAIKDVRTSTNHSNKATRSSGIFVLRPPPAARNCFLDCLRYYLTVFPLLYRSVYQSFL